MDISIVPSLLQKGLGECVVKRLVVCVLDIDVVVNLTNENV